MSSFHDSRLFLLLMSIFPPRFLEGLTIAENVFASRMEIRRDTGDAYPGIHDDIRAAYLLARIRKTDAEFALRHASHVHNSPENSGGLPEKPESPPSSRNPGPSQPSSSSPNHSADSTSLLSPYAASKIDEAHDAFARILPWHHHSLSLRNPRAFLNDVQRLSRLAEVHYTLAESTALHEKETADNPMSDRPPDELDALVCLALDLPLPDGLTGEDIEQAARDQLDRTQFTMLNSDPHSSACIGGPDSSSPPSPGDTAAPFDITEAINRLNAFYGDSESPARRRSLRDPRFAQRLRIRFLPEPESPIGQVKIVSLDSDPGRSSHPVSFVQPAETSAAPPDTTSGLPRIIVSASLRLGPRFLIPLGQSLGITRDRLPHNRFTLEGRRMALAITDEIVSLLHSLDAAARRIFGNRIDPAPGNWDLFIQRCIEGASLPP